MSGDDLRGRLRQLRLEDLFPTWLLSPMSDTGARMTQAEITWYGPLECPRVTRPYHLDLSQRTSQVPGGSILRVIIVRDPVRSYMAFSDLA